MRSRVAFAAAALSGVVSALVVTGAAAFSVDPVHTFAPAFRHGESGAGVHELITRAAVKRAYPAAPGNLISNLQFATASTDFMHHFDGEYHFDSSSTKPADRGGFLAGFDAIRKHLATARGIARGNAQFLKPTYRNLREIRAELASVLAILAGRSDCDSCSRIGIAAYRVRLSAVVPALKAYPSPDPHPPTSRKSVLSPNPDRNCGVCGKLGFVGKDFPHVVDEVEAVAVYAVRASSSLSPRDAVRRKAVRLYQAVRAYRGYFDLGHALHATQDFFTHANYVELMAGADVGEPIPAGTPVPVPSRFEGFDLPGLQRLLGDERYATLQTGAVTVSWLNEQDTCADPDNYYNPGTSKFAVRLVAGLTTVFGVTASFFDITGGSNPDPPPGLDYCHYKTRTVKGLHKDDPSVVNHLPARQAATEMSIVLLREFFASVGAVTEPPVGVPRLAGAWVGQDGGRFTIAQKPGSETVTWVGCSADGGKTWFHRFSGRIVGDSLVGRFEDGPPGTLRNKGNLVLEIVDENRLAWIAQLTVDGATTRSFPTLTRTWTRGAHSGCSTSGAGSASFAGVYATNWGLMVLRQSGATVTGCYLHDDGKLSGTIKDGKLSGTWNESPRLNDYDRGGFIFERTPTGITGRWNYDAGGGLPALQGGGGSSWSGTVSNAAPACTP